MVLVVESVIWLSIVTIASDQTILLHLITWLSEVLVQMPVPARIHELLLLTTLIAVKEVLLHGGPPLTDWRDRPGWLIDVAMRLLWQDHRVVEVILIVLLSILLRCLKLTLIHLHAAVLLLHHVRIALLGRLRHSIDEIAISGLLWSLIGIA